MTNWYQRLHETASPLEVAWTLTALLCLMVATWGLLDAWWDRQALILAKLNGGRMIVANGAVRREWARAFHLVVFIAIGVFAGLAPPANPNNPITTAGLVIATGLILVELMVATATILDRVERVRLMAYINAHELDRVSLAERAAVRAAVANMQDRMFAQEAATAELQATTPGPQAVVIVNPAPVPVEIAPHTPDPDPERRARKAGE